MGKGLPVRATLVADGRRGLSRIALAIRPEADRLSWPRVAPPRLVARRSPGRNSGHLLHLLSDIGEEVGEVALDALADLVDVVP